MPARDFPNLGLQGGYDPGENGWGDEQNLNLLKLSSLVQPVALDIVSAEPGSPTQGMVYILDESHVTHPNEIAVYDDGAWVYIEPLQGWMMHVEAENKFFKLGATAWEEFTGGGGGGGIPEAPIDGTGYVRKDAGWVAESGGGGGGGTYLPAEVVQYKSRNGDNANFVLDTTPTPGNLLVAMVSHWAESGVAVASGWSQVQRSAGTTTDGNMIVTRTVADGDTTALTPVTGTLSGSSAVLFEIANSDGKMVLPFAEYKESVSATGDLRVGIPIDGCLVVGMFMTVSANTAPVSVVGAGTVYPTTAGTSTQASPRQVTPFKIDDAPRGGETISVNYAGTPRQNAMAVVVVPSIGNFNGSERREIIGFVEATPGASEVVTRAPSARAWTLPANMVGTVVNVGTSPLSDYEFSVRQNGTQVGTITISSLGVVTKATTGGVDIPFAVGDLLTVVADSTIDSALTGVGWSILGLL